MLKPWITKDILDKCNQRDILLNEMRKETNPTKKEDLRKEYKVLRNRICEEKRQGKRNFNTTKFEKCKNKAKDIWKGIRSLVNVKNSKTSNIKLMDENGNLISDPTKIENIFNDHYSTIGTKVQRNIRTETGN